MQETGIARFDTRTFRPELTPTWLAMATLLAGHRPPEPTGEFRVVHLGGGHTVTPVVTAAVHPGAQVWWWDPDVRAAEAARHLAKSNDLANLTVHEKPALPTDLHLGPIDLVVLDGLLDSVDDALRARVFDLVGANLRPGGIVCVSYRTQVGWMEIEPVHRLIGHLVARDPRPATQAVPDVKKTLIALRDGEAGYLTLRPTVAAFLDEVLDLPVEAFLKLLVERDLRPISPAWSARAMAPLGCVRVGPALAADLPDPELAPDLAKVIAEAPSPEVREASTDLALRRTHRADVFRMGGAPLPTRDRNNAVGALEVVGLPKLESVQGRASKRLPAAAVRRALIDGPVRVKDLHAERAAAEPLLRRMLADGLVQPAPPPGSDPTAGTALLESLGIR